MKAEEILKSITPEVRRREIEKIQKVKLPAELQKWVDEYESVGGERDDFIWKWTYVGMQIHTLSSVPKEYIKSVCIIKTINIIINVLVDDIVDKRKNYKMLEEVFYNCFFKKRKSDINSLKFKEKELCYINLVEIIWDFVNKEIKKYPKHKDFKDVFVYDYRQFFNSMEYSYLIHKNPYLINKIEHGLFLPANMQSMVSNTFDLMCSVKFDIEELGMVREVTWYLQKMLRIGNCISTWDREVEENDFSSGIFVYAIEAGFINHSYLKNRKKSEIIKKIRESEIEKELLKEWENYYFEIKKFDKKIKSVNIKKILSSSEKFLIMHLISRGYK